MKDGFSFHSMVEVEKKFAVSEGELARLVAGAHFLGKKKFTDAYYDTADYALTKKDIWLRTRAGKFELKFPITGRAAAQGVTVYDEIESADAIRAKLGLPVGQQLEASLAAGGYSPFAEITTTRSTHEKGGFHIDADEADFGYAILEIELMVPSAGEAGSAGKRIVDFASAHGIALSAVLPRGKVLEYIRRNRPEHFRALEEAWGMRL